MLPDPERVVREINLEYAALDRATTTLEFPESFKHRVQLVLMPASYTWLSAAPALNPLQSSIATQSALRDYDVYQNIHHPHERVLLESFIHVILAAENKPLEINEWLETLNCWVGTIYAFLDIDNDVLDDCPDNAVREWFSEKWGRGREAKYGPMDRRITKRLGSGREFAFDMRGRPLAP